MRIAFDMLMLAQEHYGTQQAIYTFLNDLASLDTIHQYIVITAHSGARPRQGWAGNIQPHFVRLSMSGGLLLQHQLLLPPVLERLRPDLLHVAHVIAPIGWRGPLVLAPCEETIAAAHYQAMHVNAPCSWHCLHRQQLARESIRRADALIIASEQSTQLAYALSHAGLADFTIEKRVYLLNDREPAQVVLRAYAEICSQRVWSSAWQKGLEPGVSGRAAEDSRRHDAGRLVQGAVDQNEATRPTVSVVIPASRTAKAEQALASLSRQRYAGALEIIMVGPPALQLAARWPILVVHPQALYTPGKARNLGAAHARGELLLFLDDDMLVAADWVEQNVRSLMQRGVGAVGARMPGRTDTFFARCADFTNYGQYQHSHEREALLGAGSMGIARKLFIESGGFNEELSACEDIELCSRLQARGYRTLYQPWIVVIHDHHYDNLGKILRYNYTHGLQGGLVVKMRHDGLLFNSRRWHQRLIQPGSQHPPLFLLLLPLLAVWSTVTIVRLNLDWHPRVLAYAPYILLGKLAYQYGVFTSLWHTSCSRQHRRWYTCVVRAGSEQGRKYSRRSK